MHPKSGDGIVSYAERTPKERNMTTCLLTVSPCGQLFLGKTCTYRHVSGRAEPLAPNVWTWIANGSRP